MLIAVRKLGGRFFFFVVLIHLFSCKLSTDLKELSCQKIQSITEYPDSTFFSDIYHMECSGEKLYLLDDKRGDLVWISQDFQKMGYVAEHSPVGLVMPISFTLKEDTAYIYDIGSIHSLKIYADGKLLNNIAIEGGNEHRFAVSDDALFFPIPTDSTCYLKIMVQNTKERYRAGKVVKEATSHRTIMLNEKHIFYYNGNLFTVPRNYPYIDKYDANMDQWVGSFDLSSISIIKKSLDYANSLPFDPNSFYNYIIDAYLSEGYLYILCASSNVDRNKYKVNTILKLDVRGDEIYPIGYYVLPKRFYSSICVSDRYLFAVSSVSDCSIEKYELNDD